MFLGVPWTTLTNNSKGGFSCVVWDFGHVIFGVWWEQELLVSPVILFKLYVHTYTNWFVVVVVVLVDNNIIPYDLKFQS